MFPFSYDNDMRRYVLQTGSYPPPDFPSEHQVGVLLLLSHHLLTSKQISSDAIDLIKRMLDSDPAKRITLDEIMQHAFLRPKAKLWRRMRFTL